MSSTRRISALDVVRGFAPCGILLANVKPIAYRGPAGVADATVVDDGAEWLHLLVDQRFFPIFSLLFGVGFTLLYRSAVRRAERPRLVLLRRLLALLALGLAHLLLLWPGDILTVYALCGLVFLLPSTWLPRWAVAALGVALLVVSVTLLGGMFSLVPGLFLVGAALTRYGVTDRIERSWHVPLLLLVAFALLAAPVSAVQHGAAPDERAFRIAYPLAGLLIAGAYVCGLLVLLHTPARTVLTVAFVPLGRMALTNYLSATVLVIAVAALVPAPSHTWTSATVAMIAVAILAIQWLWSVLWLRRFEQGPLEAAWRRVTWWQTRHTTTGVR